MHWLNTAKIFVLISGHLSGASGIGEDRRSLSDGQPWGGAVFKDSLAMLTRKQDLSAEELAEFAEASQAIAGSGA